MIRKCVLCEKRKFTWWTPMVRIDIGDKESGNTHRFYVCEEHLIFATTEDLEEALSAGINE